MLPSTFTLIAATVVCAIGSSQSFPKMDFSDVVLRTRAKKNSEVSDLAKKLQRLIIRFNETVRELYLSGGKTALIETRINVLDSKLNDTEKQLSQSKSEKSQMLTSMEGTIAGIQKKLTSALAEVSALKSDVEMKGTPIKKEDLETLALSNSEVKGKLANVQRDMKILNKELHSVNAMEKKMEKMSTKLEILAKVSLCRQHKGFVYDGRTDMCWRLFPNRLSNPLAEIECGKQGPRGRLVIQDTTEKHDVIKAYIRTEGITYSVWVGGNRNSGGRFVWSTGKAMDRVQWCPNEPQSIEAKCVSLWEYMGFCFDDITCTDQAPHICEIPMV